MLPTNPTETPQATVAPTTNMYPISPSEPSRSKNINTKSALLYSSFVVFLIYFTQFSTNIIFAMLYMNSSYGNHSFIEGFNIINIWAEESMSIFAFIGYVYLFISTFLILTKSRLGKYFIYLFYFGLVLSSVYLFYAIAFGGFIAITLILDTLLPPLLMLFIMKKNPEFRIKSFVRYSSIVFIFTLIAHGVTIYSTLNIMEQDYNDKIQMEKTFEEYRVNGNSK